VDENFERENGKGLGVVEMAWRGTNVSIEFTSAEGILKSWRNELSH
jgi:hypothetical protein